MVDRLKSINDELRGKDLDAGPWLPLESNPDVFTSFARKVGLPEPWQFVDIFGLDPEMLGMIPGPVAAVIVLFPCTERIYAARAAEDRALRAQQARDGVSAAAAAAYHLEQVASFGNACGTIAAVHVLANAEIGGMVGPITSFREETAAQTPSERGQTLLTTRHLKQESDEAAEHAGAHHATGAKGTGTGTGRKKTTEKETYSRILVHTLHPDREQAGSKPSSAVGAKKGDVLHRMFERRADGAILELFSHHDGPAAGTES